MHKAAPLQHSCPRIVLEPFRIRWWDWPAEKIARNVHLIAAGDPGALEESR